MTEFNKAFSKVHSYGLLNLREPPNVESRINKIITDLREGGRKMLNALATLKQEFSDYYDLLEKI
jgi:hypothetical protein